jgi:hypothetical protein
MAPRRAATAYLVIIERGNAAVGRLVENGPMKTPIRVGTHIEGVHWVAEYFTNTREIRVFREGQEVETFDAPVSMFGEEREAGSASDAATRAEEAALLATLRRYVADGEPEE